MYWENTLKVLQTTAILVMIALLSGCANLPKTRQTDLFWPGPPDPPRIRYLKSFSSPRDLKIHTSWPTRIYRFITGKKETDVSFSAPFNIFVNRHGDIYLSDTGARAIHGFGEKKKQYTRITVSGSTPLLFPIGITGDDRGYIYVSDSLQKQVLVFDRKGNRVFSIDSVNFQRPTGIAFNQQDQSLYVVDTPAHDIKVFDQNGNFKEVFGHRGTAPGEFNFPTCICIDRSGRIYIGDSLNFRIQIFNRPGEVVKSFGQAGNGSGYFSKIKGIAVDGLGHIYVSDAQFDAVQIFDPEGNFLLAFGESGTGPGEFRFPAGIFIDKHDIIYIVDKLNRRVQVFAYQHEK